MAPVRGKTVSAKGASKRKAMTNSKPTSRPSSSSTSSSKSKSSKPPSKSSSAPVIRKKGAIPRKKKRVYTEKELNIPALNMITPAGVVKPQGKKKGKVFVDDQESMMTILAMVNADKEGQIESKMIKARQMEEIRQARAREMEERQRERKAKFVSVPFLLSFGCYVIWTLVYVEVDARANVWSQNAG